MKIAVVGSGVSGLVAARLLADTHDVTLFEADDRPGGHAHTHTVNTPAGPVAVDTGFMVFNDRTYPGLCRLFELLGVASRPSDMSFSFRCDAAGLEYQGGTLRGLLAQPRNLARPAFLSMVRDVLRFNRLGLRHAQGAPEPGLTVGGFLDRARLGRPFREWYLRPMAAAIWSADPAAIDGFPAHFLLGFFANHGLLQLRDRPRWRTVMGGSRGYVAALVAGLRGRLRTSSPVESVRRDATGVTLTGPWGVERFDRVVLAAHADQSLAMLADADDLERHVLGALPYQPSEAVMHTDASLMPRRRAAWASWNYTAPAPEHGARRPVMVTYHLSRLQGLPTPPDLFLTLNPALPIDPARVIQRIPYAHPRYTLASLDAQRQHDALNGRRHTYYCGAYWGYGFHEDGLQSGLRVAAKLGGSLDALAGRVRSPLTLGAPEPEAAHLG